jgi:hypothetical protein
VKYFVAALIALPLPMLVWMMWTATSLAVLTFFVTATLDRHGVHFPTAHVAGVGDRDAHT